MWNTHMINQYSRRNLFSEFPGHVIWYCTISKRSSRFKSFCGKTTTTEPLSIESPWPCLRLYLVIMGCFGIGGVRLKNLQKGHIHISRVPKFSFHYNNTNFTNFCFLTYIWLIFGSSFCFIHFLKCKMEHFKSNKARTIISCTL